MGRIEKIDSEGVIDVQAHAMTHTWYPCEATIVDWHRPKDSYYWLYWNAFPEKKPFWLTEYDETMVSYGYPIFKYAKSISGRRFNPKQEVIDFSMEYYAKNKNSLKDAFPAFQNELKERFKGDLGSFETEEEFKQRLRVELIESKKIAENILNKKMEFLAWPGGAVSDCAYEIAREAGYLSWTKKGKPYNERTDSLSDVYRLGGWSGIKIKNKPNTFIEYWFLKMQLQRAKGNKSIINKFFGFIGNIYRKRHIKSCRKNGENWK